MRKLWTFVFLELINLPWLLLSSGGLVDWVKPPHMLLYTRVLLLMIVTMGCMVTCQLFK